MAPTTIPGWKRKLCIQKAHVKHAFFSEDMTYFHLRAALAHHNNSDPKAELASLLGDNDSTTDTLNNLNIGNTVENELAFAQFKEETEALKGETDKAAWKTKMEESKARAKARVDQAIDLAYDGAADVISQLPDSAQDAAFNIFDVGQEFVWGAFQTLIDRMKAVLNSIIDFMKGIWTAMVNAWNTVVGAVSTAINWIRGIFLAGSSDPAPPAREPGTTGPDPNKDGDVDTTQVSVNFKLQWLSNPPLAQYTVDASIMYLTQQLGTALNNQYTIHLGSAYQVGGGWQCDAQVPDVDEADIAGVLQVVKAVIKTEDRRRVPLGNEWANVPTPDPVMYFNSFQVLESTSQQPSLTAPTQQQKKTGAPLPVAMRSRLTVMVNGH